MSITEELRKWVEAYPWRDDHHDIAYANALIDRIDAAHERELREQYDKGLSDGYGVGFANADGQSWLSGYSECHAALMEGNEAIAADLEKAGWVKLPVDADGEVWHVGDFAVGEVNPKNPKAIERMIWYGPDSGWQLETNSIIYPCPDRPRHRHKPTVEDMLREFADCYLDYEGIPSAGRRGIGEALMDEYAARIREAVTYEEDK